MPPYLARTTRILNSNFSPYPRIIAASSLRPHPARQVQNQRTLWNFSWLTGGNSTLNASSSAKKDGSESGSGSSNGGKVEVETYATRGMKRQSDGPRGATTMMTSDSHSAVPTPASTPTTTSTSTSTSTSSSSSPLPATTSSLPNPEATAPSREEKEKAAIQALLDRDGGSLGFEFEDGAPEGGQRRSVKREMFRVI